MSETTVASNMAVPGNSKFNVKISSQSQLLLHTYMHPKFSSLYLLNTFIWLYPAIMIFEIIYNKKKCFIWYGSDHIHHLLVIDSLHVHTIHFNYTISRSKTGVLSDGVQVNFSYEMTCMSFTRMHCEAETLCVALETLHVAETVTWRFSCGRR